MGETLEARSKKEDYISQQTLLNVNGWTKTLIKKFLPEPVLVQNPFYKSGAKMKLYNKSEVANIEATIEFQLEKEKAERRRTCGRKKQKEKKLEIFFADEDVIYNPMRENNENYMRYLESAEY